jgi:hypothetical protein
MPTPPSGYKFGFTGLRPSPVSMSLGTGYKRLRWETFEDPKTLDREIGTFPLIAYRTWNVMHPGYLTDSNNFALWEPRQRIEATCRNMKNHSAPQAECTCGVYALKTMENLEEHLGGNLGYGRTECIGEVWLWGTVVECTNGYRAQYAYPKSITLRVHKSLGMTGAFDEKGRNLAWAQEMAAKLHERYGVPAKADLIAHPEPEVQEEIPFWNYLSTPQALFSGLTALSAAMPPVFGDCVEPESVNLIKEPTDQDVVKFAGVPLPQEEKKSTMCTDEEIDKFLDSVSRTMNIKLDHMMKKLFGA